MARAADFLEQPSNLISNLYSIPLGIEKIRKEYFALFGLPELLLVWDL
jgi:hypothetical protein